MIKKFLIGAALLAATVSSLAGQQVSVDYGKWNLYKDTSLVTDPIAQFDTQEQCIAAATTEGQYTCSTSSKVHVTYAPDPDVPVTGVAYYFSDCEEGANPSCVIGNNSNAGTSPDAPKRNLDGFKLPSGAGNAFRFARGGSFNASIELPAGSNGADPTRFESYVPEWCKQDCWKQLPILNSTADSGGIRSWFKGGFIIRDLDLRGKLLGSGVNFTGSSNITVDNLRISNFLLGAHVTYGHQGTVTKNITIKNSSIIRNRSQGFLGGADNLLLEGNHFDYNGLDNGTRDHNIYLSGGTFTMNGLTIRNNLLTHNAQYQDYVKECRSVSLVAHGSLHNVTIEGNRIIEEASRAVCWGIALNGVTGSSVPQQFPGLKILNNEVSITGKGNVGITCNSCPGVVIEGNTITKNGDGFTGIFLPSGIVNLARGDLPDTSPVIRNNKLVINGSGTGIKSDPRSFRDVVENNEIVFSETAKSAVCMNFEGRSLSTYASLTGNTCKKGSTSLSEAFLGTR